MGTLPLPRCRDSFTHNIHVVRQSLRRNRMDPQTAARNLRKCLGRFSTGVTVVTYRSTEGVRGATMNSFTSVSLEPPLVLISVARTSRACASIQFQPFSVNVLSASQMDIALHFAGRTSQSIHIAWEDKDMLDGTPSLAGAIAVFQCKPWRCYDGGDHVLVLGEVTSSAMREGEPLAFSDGRFMSIGLPLAETA